VGELTPEDVSNVVLSELEEGPAPATVRRFESEVWSFLRYCFLVGVVDRDLSAAGFPVSVRDRSLLPEGISPDESAPLLAACDRRSARRRRDYAVIVLMLRLGLRATEVATLQLDEH
jgi:site-specific recombinase XerD